VGIWWVPHSSDSLDIERRAVFRSSNERLVRFVRLIHILCHSTDHGSLFPVNNGVNYTILDRLGNNILCVLFRVEVKFDTDIGKRDSGIGEGDGSKSSLDDDLTQTQDQESSVVGNKGLFMG